MNIYLKEKQTNKKKPPQIFTDPVVILIIP